mmetsp:Transcript_22660/g.32873  ORF Transcript_22660/g.32873 Transcript_22660/m.32873 type:complete len:213 (-) Transcript_22660:70-708(-)
MASMPVSRSRADGTETFTPRPSIVCTAAVHPLLRAKCRGVSPLNVWCSITVLSRPCTFSSGPPTSMIPTRYAAVSFLPPRQARVKGVIPCRFLAWMSAPWSTRKVAVATFAAQCRAVYWLLSRACTSAPTSTRYWATATWPPEHAACSGVHPPLLLELTSAPSPSRNCTVSRVPREAAWCSGVRPLLSLVKMPPPCPWAPCFCFASTSTRGW